MDEHYMRLALREADRAAGHGDVPVGAVIAHEGEVIATGRNERELRGDPTAVPRVVYATTDPKAGAAGSVFDVLAEPRLNHRPEVAAGLFADEAADQLRSYFAARR